MTVEQPKRELFKELEARLSAREPKDTFKVRRDQWVLATLLFGVAMTVPSMLGVAGWWVAWMTAVGLLAELCALGVFTYRQLRDVAPDFFGASRKFAEELDDHFVDYEEIRFWLRSMSIEDRRRRAAYVESRLESIGSRYPIVFGAVDKLGILPALAGVFLQIQAIKTVSLTGGLVGFAVLVLYGMAIWMMRFRLQLQLYARLLKAADSDF